jgi:hypothetical protein
MNRGPTVETVGYFLSSLTGLFKTAQLQNSELGVESFLTSILFRLWNRLSLALAWFAEFSFFQKPLSRIEHGWRVQQQRVDGIDRHEIARSGQPSVLQAH